MLKNVWRQNGLLKFEKGLERKLVDLGMLNDGAVHCHRHHRRKGPAKEHCVPVVLRMWVGSCAVRVHCSQEDGYYPSPEALPGEAVWKEPGGMLVPVSAG